MKRGNDNDAGDDLSFDDDVPRKDGFWKKNHRRRMPVTSVPNTNNNNIPEALKRREEPKTFLTTLLPGLNNVEFVSVRSPKIFRIDDKIRSIKRDFEERLDALEQIQPDTKGRVESPREISNLADQIID
ncbi:hypothetical protein HELRODRAFT_179699 [Helobdella robusta]|uniref:Uncharacterized protein n=1 Tax=Helobdella robusta TaxID=6412 RepID=T1FF16_HELRO|nr:hypothetical protein HELRODRAFT_179699 [Helobdella robusta]ESN95110.1 hypothetical protein HELRODRAFT_179699 [Helobdella robusta]